MNIHSLKPVAALLSVALFAGMLFTYALGDDESSVVKFDATERADILTSKNESYKRSYFRLPEKTRKGLESAMWIPGSLGLSSTGRIELVGVYSHWGSEKREGDSLIYHLTQTDLNDSRLVWSILFDSQNGKVQILYDVNGKTGSEFIVPNDDE
jgi:hypothetical protein